MNYIIKQITRIILSLYIQTLVLFVIGQKCPDNPKYPVVTFFSAAGVISLQKYVSKERLFHVLPRKIKDYYTAAMCGPLAKF